jgi:hypothetical protein
VARKPMFTVPLYSASKGPPLYNLRCYTTG